MIPQDLIEKRNELLRIAVELFGIDETKIYSTKQYPYSEIRYAIFKILRDDGATLQLIGDLFNRNHASVLSGIRRVTDAIIYPACDPKLHKIYLMLVNQYSYDGQTIITSKKIVKQWLEAEEIDEDTMSHLLNRVEQLNQIIY